MKQHACNIKNRVQEQLRYMVMFALIFSLIGSGLNQMAKLYFERVDSTQYYRVIPPVRTDKKQYKPCDPVEVFITREAKIDTQGKSIVSLTLVNENPLVKKRITTITRDVIVTKGIDTYVATWNLPCDIRDGTYYWEIDFRYFVKDITKTTHFTTDSFIIKK